MGSNPGSLKAKGASFGSGTSLYGLNEITEERPARISIGSLSILVPSNGTTFQPGGTILTTFGLLRSITRTDSPLGARAVIVAASPDLIVSDFFSASPAAYARVTKVTVRTINRTVSSSFLSG